MNFTKMIIAMNDVSLCLSLEHESFKLLNEDARVYWHYIDRLHDSGELKRAKMIVLYEKIKNMEMREKIEEYYPGIIDILLMNLHNINPDVSASVMKRVYEWWN